MYMDPAMDSAAAAADPWSGDFPSHECSTLGGGGRGDEIPKDFTVLGDGEVVAYDSDNDSEGTRHSSATTSGSTNEDFAGASAAATNSMHLMHKCAMCGVENVNYSYFAHVYRTEGYPLAKMPDILFQRAIAEAEVLDTQVNMFDGQPILQACVRCCAEHHAE